MLSLKPVKIVATYALASALWILFSDQAVGVLFSHSADAQILVSMVKGWLFVAVTSAILLGLLRRYQGQTMRQQAALQDREEYIHTIFNSVNDAIFIHSWPDGGIVDVNQRACEVFGYSREELLRLSVEAVSSGIPPYDLARARELMQWAFEGEPQVSEWQSKGRDGRVFWMEVSVRRAQILGNVRILVSCRDLSGRKEAELALARERQFTDALIDSVPGLLYLYDDAGLLLRWNRMHEELTGYSREELAQKHLLDWYQGDPASTERIAKAIERVRSTGAGSEEAELQIKSGERIPFYFTAVRLELDGKSYFTGIGIDITERKRAEQALQASEQRFSELIRFSFDSITILDKDGVQIFVSDAVERMLGFHPSELTNIPVMERMIHPDDQEQVAAAFATIVEQGRGGARYRHRHKNGSWVFLEAWGTNQLENPGIRGIVVNVRDITDRMRTEEALRQSEERFRRIVETANEGIITIDDARRISYCNKVMIDLLGYAEEELLQKKFSDLIFPEDMPRYMEEGVRRRAGLSSRFERRFRRKSGAEVWTNFAASPIIDENGVYLGSFAMVSDITERKRSEQAFQESEGRFRRIVETANEGIWSLDKDIRTIYVNSTMQHILGYAPEEMLGRPFVDFIYPEDLDDHEQQVAERRSGVAGHYERRFRRKDGAEVWCLVSASSVMGADGSFQGSFAMVTDITERKQLEEQLLFRALHDPLTGLANRRLCQDRIAQANERAARRPESTFAVVFIDLDRFKFINDSLGHEAGDCVLREVASRLLSCARRVDTVCRYGGDEFILVLEDISKREAVRSITRVRASLRTPMTIGTHEIQVAASYGIAYAPQENCQAEELLRNANIALHCAKISGRDRIITYRKGMHEAAIHVMSLQSDMRRGLDAKEFFMVYQPIFRLGSNRLAGFEALIRWRHPQRGIVGPKDFINLAEEYGFIFELGNFALRQACTDMVDLLCNLPAEDQLTVSVNLSPRQLSRQGLAEQIEQTLVATGLPPQALVLEITESSIMQYPEASANILTRLKGKGVGIAIDDFGTGYSSMSALQKLPLDRLKVDMSFVRRMEDSSQDREIVRAIITLAHSLCLQTVAEGIETEEQRELLRGMHCDLGQGYLCSRPMLLEDVPAAIRRGFCPHQP